MGGFLMLQPSKGWGATWQGHCGGKSEDLKWGVNGQMAFRCQTFRGYHRGGQAGWINGDLGLFFFVQNGVYPGVSWGCGGAGVGYWGHQGVALKYP